MRLYKAIRDLFQNYRYIMPTFLTGTIILYGLSHVLPLIGTLLFLPINIGIAYVMFTAIAYKNNTQKFHLLYGFKIGSYTVNVIYLFLRQISYLLPLGIGAFLFAFFRGVLSDFSIPYSLAILNLIIFIIPSMILSLMLAMVPYLLADYRFDQRKRNPLKASFHIMKGNYIKLLTIRIFFIPWLLLQSSSMVVVFVNYYERFIGETGIPLTYIPVIYIVLPIILLLFLPWYHMMHAELYVQNRHKLSSIPK